MSCISSVSLIEPTGRLGLNSRGGQQLAQKSGSSRSDLLPCRSAVILLLHNRYRVPGRRGARGRGPRVADPRAPRRGRRGARARLGGARRSARPRAGLLRGGLAPEEVARRGAPHRRARRPRPQRQPDARLARARRRPRGRRARRAAPPQLPARVRGRHLLHARRGLHALPRAQHAARACGSTAAAARGPSRPPTPPRSRCGRGGSPRRPTASSCRARSRCGGCGSSARRSTTARACCGRSSASSPTRSRAAAGRHVLYAGRLSHEKGVADADRRLPRRRAAARRGRRRARGAPSCARSPPAPTCASPAASAPQTLADAAPRRRASRSCPRATPRSSRSPRSRRWPPGVPVVAARSGGLAELVPDEGLYPPGDVAALAARARRAVGRRGGGRARARRRARALRARGGRARARRGLRLGFSADARARHRRSRLHRLQPRRRPARARRRGERRRRPLDRAAARTSTARRRRLHEASITDGARDGRAAAPRSGPRPSSTSPRRSTSAARSPTRRSTPRSTSAAPPSMLEAARAAGTRRFVLASTGGAIYGDTRPPADARGRPAAPISPYGASQGRRRDLPRRSTRRLHGLSTRRAALRQRLRPAPGPARRGRRDRDLLPRRREQAAGCACSATGARRATSSTSATSRRRCSPRRSRDVTGAYNIGTGRGDERARARRAARARADLRARAARRDPALVPGRRARRARRWAGRRGRRSATGSQRTLRA